MKRFKSLLVPIGLHGCDSEAIRWAAKVSQLAESDDVLFFHAVDVPEVPEKLKERYENADPHNKNLQARLKELVKENWDGFAQTKIRFKVVNAVSEVFAVLQEVLDQNSDLIIVGRDAYGRDMPIRLARKATCSVMAVPTGSAAKLESILVPTDFSEYSKVAMDVALAFAESEHLKSLHSLHVYDLGAFSGRVTLPESELISMAEEFAEEKHTVFVEGLATSDVTVETHLVRQKTIPAGVLQCLNENGIDMIVAGCRGRNTVTALLLGSNAEELLKHAPVPVLAAKIKGTGQKLLEALLHESLVSS